MKNSKLLPIIIVTAIVIASINIAFAAPLSLPYSQPSNNFFGRGALYAVGFETGTTGTIAKIQMDFPAGTSNPNIKVADYSGIGPGTISAVGNQVNYTVTSPVEVTSGTTIQLLLGKIANSDIVGHKNLIITTFNDSDAIIDGPTNAGFNIQNSLGTTFYVDDVNGRVGIGDATPSEALDVNGNIRLTGNIVSPGDICIGSCP